MFTAVSSAPRTVPGCGTLVNPQCWSPPDPAGSSTLFEEAACPRKGTWEGGKKLVASAASLTREGKPKPQEKMALLN